MTLCELLEGVAFRKEPPSAAAELSVTGLDYDSRRVEKGFVFFAFAGARVDGRRFAQQALEQGACAVVSEAPRPQDFTGLWIEVEHGRRALATAARNFYQHPDERIHFTGITGTNGKTTTSYVLEAILREAGQITGLIGTIEYRLAGEARDTLKTRMAPNTTPESLDVMRFAAELERLGGTHLISEVSSHALALGRVHGFRFHTAVFTNLTRDHLDFHGSLEDYAAAKRLLFAPEEAPAPDWAVLNADDPFTASVRPAANTLLYGIGRDASIAPLRAENIHSSFEGVRFDLYWEGARQPIESSLAGRINVLNILAAAGAALSYGIPLETIARGVAACRAVPGRFERVDAGQPFLVIVDYAHTDDALRNLPALARQMTAASGARVITLFGCGGDRDRTKRPKMGQAAGEGSDFVVATSDNPRSEDPAAILAEIEPGLKSADVAYTVEVDRTSAIRLALEAAKPGDVVLLAGKGHEKEQILADRTIPFDDAEVALSILAELGYGVGQ